MKRRLIQLALIGCIVLAASASSAYAQPLVQSHTLTIQLTAKRAAGAKAIMPKVERLFATTRFFPGRLYAFDRYFGDIVSALNVLAHRAYFWDSDGQEKPLFEVVRGSAVRNDHIFGAYAVSNSLKAEEFVWRVHADYGGIPPRILSRLNGNQLSLSVSYSNEIQPSATPTVRERFQILETELKAKIGHRPIGVSVISVDDPTLTLGVNDSILIAVASAWKSIGLMYFLEHTDPSIWGSVPIRYWRAINTANMPAQYHNAWLHYGKLLEHVYISIVFSGNEETSEMLAYVYNTRFSSDMNSNPIIAFNDWWLRNVSPQSKSGLFNWYFGVLRKPGLNDPRYGGRKMIVNGKALPISNMYSARDLAQTYLYLLTTGKSYGYYDTAFELLSIRSPIISKIESHLVTVQETAIRTAGKDGYFFADSTNSRGHAANNDAGLITLPDGRRFIVAFMALDPDLIDVDVVAMTLRGIINSKPG